MTKRVLIVDDSKLARIVAARAVKALRPDWICVEAADGDEALAILDEWGADLVLLDFNMPGKNGLELAKEIRSRSMDVPVVIVTANIQDQIVAGARDMRAYFVAKPITEGGLGRFFDAAVQRYQQHGRGRRNPAARAPGPNGRRASPAG